MRLSRENKRLIVKTLLFFVIVNTAYYWEGKLSWLAIPATVLLAILYLALCISLLRQVYYLFQERFRDKQRFIPTTVLIAVLGLVAYKPFGLIDFSKLEGNSLLVVVHEGAANCTITLKLKDDYTFRETTICFGVEDVTGKYILSNDTLFFDKVSLPLFVDSYYKFGVITPPDSQW